MTCPPALQAAGQSTTNGETSTLGDSAGTVDSMEATATTATEVTAGVAAETEALVVVAMASL